MKEILAKLRRPLRRDEIDFRVGTVITSGQKAFATILAYKDARTDMNVLDEATDGLWQNKYERDSRGVLQCGIGIKAGEEWVWKYSNGTETQVEKEKGEYSDAFKRAGFMWGIGRELYDVPSLFVELRASEFRMDNGKAKGTNKLRPNDWEWTISEDMTAFAAMDKDGERLSVGVMDEVVTEPKVAQQAPTTPLAPSSVLKTCPVCFKEHTGKYPKCFDCWKNPAPVKTETPSEEIALEDIPF
jgi:hypothetical protein